MNARQLCQFLLVIALMGSSLSLKAATIVVDLGGTGAYTTIQAAVDASVSGDTIQVQAGTYNEKVTLPGDKNLTLESAPGAAVTIHGPVDKAIVVNGIDNSIVIRGDAINRMVLTGTNTNAIDSNTNGSVLVEHVEISGTTNAWGSDFKTYVETATVTLNDCLWTCSGGWTACCVEGPGTFTINNCVFQPTGNVNALRSWVSDPGSVVVNNSTFEGFDSGAGFDMSNSPVCVFSSDMTDKAQTYIFNNCRFNGHNWVYSCAAGSFPNNTGTAKKVRLINPEIGIVDERGSTQGPTRTCGAFQTECGEQLSIEGSGPDAKCDLRNSSFFNYLLSMRYGGELTLKDCILRDGAWTSQAVDLPGDKNYAKTVNIERCLFPGVGKIGTINQSGIVGTGAITINVNNSIIQYADELFSFSTHASAATVNLKHTTLYGLEGTPVSRQAIALESHDSLNADYCIFERGTSTMSYFCNAGFTGLLNVIHVPSGTGFSGTVPAGMILGDPLLLEDCTIGGDTSVAVNAASGSTETIDYFGASRSVPDIGAVEYFQINAVQPKVWTLMD